MKNQLGYSSSEASARPSIADFAPVLDLAPLPAIIYDSTFKIVAANLLANDLLGYETLIGTNIGTLFPSADAALPQSIDEYRCEDGETRKCEVFLRSLPGGARIMFFNDVTERKAAEERLAAELEQQFKTLRAEALETLAGGIAHEFNNLLAVILLQTEMMTLALPDDDALAARVTEIGAVANEAAAMVRQLLAFGRRQAMNPAPIVLNRVIDSCARELKLLLGGGIELQLDLEPSLGVSSLDSPQIAQALMYLALNARDGMPDGGRLRIRTSNVGEDGPFVHRTQAAGRYVQVEIADDGAGLDPRFLDQIFEPFFSATGAKKSSGLGLATVWGIVKQSGGYIAATSTRGEGTTFTIQFPRLDEPKPERKAELKQTRNSAGATVLLVDDEAMVRRVAAEGLRKAGYRVIEAAGGAQAVDLARGFSEKIHLIVTDFSMPSMNGDDAALQIRQAHPNAGLLLMSGDPGIFQDVEAADAHYIAKPFTIKDLVQKVGAILDSKAAGGG